MSRILLEYTQSALLSARELASATFAAKLPLCLVRAVWARPLGCAVFLHDWMLLIHSAFLWVFVYLVTVTGKQFVCRQRICRGLASFSPQVADVSIHPTGA